VRRYWRGDRGLLPELATRVAGSSDLYQGAGRQPTASINFVTCHDGFTLRDLVSYTQKRNEANGEHNNDGESNNLSTNGGVEGPTADATIEAGRLRLVRNFLATLFVSQGVPMICAGDEMGRTQRGNNNAYCQDNEVSWVNWTLTPAERQLLEFTRSLIVIRHAHQVLRRRRYFDGQGHNGDKDVVWYDPRGREMSPAAWNEDTAVVGMRISATVVDERTGLTDPHEHDVLVALFNADALDIGFVLPKAEGAWVALFDTSDETSQAALAPRRFVGGDRFPLRPRSVVLLRAEPPPTAPPEPPVARLRNRPRRRAADFRR
jgi:glycogen operon protein